jgi:hypothetical protein
MKYLKRYESAGFDADFAAAKIKSRFSEEEAASMLASEIKEWADEEFYSQNGNGEAEEIVVHQMVAWYCREFGQKLPEQEEAALEDAIRHAYECIN